MRTLSLYLILGLLQQLPPLQQLAPPAVPELPASVEGVVLDSETKQPLAGATVSVQDRLHSGGRMITVTGNDGRFAFRSVAPGQYLIEASRSGYVSEMAGELLGGSNFAPNPLAPTNLPVVQQLRPGQVLSGLSLVLTPGGVISGRLRDERGELVVGAVVQVLKTIHKNGLRERTLVQSVVSNDLGEYRFFMLKPGQYSIALVPSTLWIENVSTSSFSIPLFYPGTLDTKEAKVLDLRVGETLDSVDFLSVPVRNRRISGNVLGNGSEGVTVTLSPVNGTARTSVSMKGDHPTMSFQFSDVVPGSYMLVAHNVFGRAAIPLDVRNADVLGTRVQLGEGFRIPSRARIEGRPPGNDPELEKLYFSVRPDVPVPGLEPELYSPFADGGFKLEVFRRDYWIDLARPDDYYIKAITLEGVDVLNQGLHAMSSMEGPLEVVVDNNFGEVQGTAAATNVTVVLVPDAARRNQRPLYKSIKSSNGVFRFEKVPPGDYKLFVWSEDRIDNGGPWLDPEYLRIYEDRATPVRIQGEVKTVLDRPIPVF